MSWARMVMEAEERRLGLEPGETVAHARVRRRSAAATAAAAAAAEEAERERADELARSC